jgi:SAM-dependent methyltransferase
MTFAMGPRGPAERWRQALEQWAIPEAILSAAPESPWGFPVELFATRAEAAADPSAAPSTTARIALEALPPGGSVLDVGSGAGAASLPLAGRAGRFAAVDTSMDMLDAFGERAQARGVAFEAVSGRWPDVAPEAPVVDVVLCAHVFYNAPDLDRFVRALTDHARRRVVVELTPEHPASDLNPLWLRFHGLVRPTVPTAADAADVVESVTGSAPERVDWTAPAGGSLPREAMVAWIRRRLCLPREREPEVEEAIAPSLIERDGRVHFGPRDAVTLWWPGSADRAPDGAGST